MCVFVCLSVTDQTPLKISILDHRVLVSTQLGPYSSGLRPNLGNRALVGLRLNLTSSSTPSLTPLNMEGNKVGPSYHSTQTNTHQARESLTCLPGVLIQAPPPLLFQPVKQVPPQPRSPPPPASVSMATPLSMPSTAVTTATSLAISTSPITMATARLTTSSLQHVHLASTVVTSFNMPKTSEEESNVSAHTNVAEEGISARPHISPSEDDSSVSHHLKTLRSLRHAGITAVFTGQTKAESALLLCPEEGAVLVDVDTLVPTHDAEGRLIPEWKRQVMVRRLHAGLSEEHQQHKDPGWRFSQVYGALLGPFGELLTEDDLLALERQIASASQQQRFHAYEAELTQLAERLQAILPAPLISITVNPQPQQLSPGNEGGVSLPVWYPRIYAIVRSLNHLLSTLPEQSMAEGLEGDTNAGLPLALAPSVLTLGPVGPLGGHSSSGRERVQQEIQQAGVSVHALRASFEGQVGTAKQPLTGRLKNPELHSYQRTYTVSMPTDKLQLQSVATETDNQRGETEHAPNVPHLRVDLVSDPRVTSMTPDRGVTFDPKSTKKTSGSIRYKRPPVVDSGSLRKERIVVLFLSHWKRSAYAISLRAKLTLGIHEHGNTPGLQGATEPTSGEFQCHSPAPDALTDSSLYHSPPTDTQLSPSLLHLNLPTHAQTSYNELHQSLASIPSDARAGNSSVYQSLPVCTRASHNFKQLGHAPEPLRPRPDSMHGICRQMMFVRKIFGTWRRCSGGGSTDSGHRSPGASPACRVTYSPEQFLSEADGGAVPYSRLTLDLFMLGYLRLLECELPADERKMRHLLCFEVFDHVGRYPWETVRSFHAAVLREIQEGRRSWGDGFDDIKARFFPGEDEEGHVAAARRRASGSGRHLVVPQLTVDGSALEQGGGVAGYKEEEACGFITRSFAFWKQQEAELFHQTQLP
ncbi:hypothetical protein ACEWY4_021926 [Coilia grayii]|uniref:Espin-like protein n=1 Tax=Coilia grayii TaxID=363190 RepID=A0ABD1J4K1_9TELE